MKTLNGECTYTSWEEETYAERDGQAKLARAAVTQDLLGDLTGKGEVTWLMSYQEDGTARFVGLQLFEGVIEGRQGSAVLETVGEYDGSEATWTGSVIEGSGSGGWTGLRGEGRFRAPHGPTATYTLEYSFD
jgi:Protein of unknown function (DUF3224)